MLFITQIKSLSFAIEPFNVVEVKEYPITWTRGLNNNIRVIKFTDGLKYFKECKKMNINDEVNRVINEYFGEYLDNLFGNDKDLLIKTLSAKNNFKKFFNIDFYENHIQKYLNIKKIN